MQWRVTARRVRPHTRVPLTAPFIVRTIIVLCFTVTCEEAYETPFALFLLCTVDIVAVFRARLSLGCPQLLLTLPPPGDSAGFAARVR